MADSWQVDREETRRRNYREARNITWIGAAINFLIGSLKILFGILGHSHVLVADGVHSFSDLATDFVVLVGIRAANRPFDEGHPYGHGRFETMGTLVLGVVLFGAGAWILVEILGRIQRGIFLVPTAPTLFIAILSIITKESLFRWTLKVGRRTGNSSVIANAWDHRSDALSSLAALVGIGGARAGWPVLDPVAAVVVSLLVMAAGWKISRGAVLELVDTAIPGSIREQISRVAKETPGVLGHHALRTRRVGQDIYVDVHIEVDPRLSVLQGHDVAKSVKEEIRKRITDVADVLVHMEPEGNHSPDSRTRKGKRFVQNIVKVSQEAQGVRGVHGISTHYLGNRYLVHLDIEVDPEISVQAGHQIAEEVRERIRRLEEVEDAVVHIEPFPDRDRERDAGEERIG
ncbi:MAG: cation-efflux pump [Candidatus Tectomicrobia bacterium]|uniref:Cation-efflux pump n=1 Tax=Tectimicrobiota bacterium TaxID=2528274 RepID=A0A932GRG6_UNCTE|nr:cation-efflux pump [Candidatus Tectomicrobia bacterium]